MSRLRNARERVERLTADPVAPPPDPLRFTARIVSGDPGAPTGDLRQEIHGAGRPGGETCGPPSGRRTAAPAPQTGSAQPRAGLTEPRAGLTEPRIGLTEPRAEFTGLRAELREVRVSGRLYLPELRIRTGERLLVTGPNGAGKTTLMRVLTGGLRPDAGSARVSGTVGYLRQEESAWEPGLTVLQAFAAGRPGDAGEHAEELLSLGLFRRADLRLRIGELSYGQRRRVELARLVSEPVDLLLLDEPTNHLSPALVEELEQALAGYRGRWWW
nr:hypothetical protein GCM10020093_107160 [Planobispora longispora]